MPVDILDNEVVVGVTLSSDSALVVDNQEDSNSFSVSADISEVSVVAQASEDEELVATMEEESNSFSTSFDISYGRYHYEDYTGVYEVTSFLSNTSLTTSIVLPTNDKHMTDNVTIYSLPTSEEYNDAGGVTFTIGE